MSGYILAEGYQSGFGPGVEILGKPGGLVLAKVLSFL
jgi:hypothetical protein